MTLKSEEKGQNAAHVVGCGVPNRCEPLGGRHALRAGFLLGVVAFLVGLAGCSGEDAPATDDDPHYVTTIPPFAAIVAPVVGDRGSVTALLAAGDSPHTYEPRPSDVRHAEEGTAVLYGTPDLDAWAADLPAARRIALIDLVPDDDRLPSVSEGHGHATDDTDPHFWTDPMAVRALLPALVDTLCALDAAGCDIYAANADSFSTALTELNAEVESLLRPVRAKSVMLAQPFFQYFMHRYGPRLAAVVEPHPGKEPSPRALQALIEQTRREGIQVVFVQNQLPPRAAEAVAEGAGLPLVVLDPLGGEAGRRSYPDLIRYNARVIHDALSNPTAP